MTDIYKIDKGGKILELEKFNFTDEIKDKESSMQRMKNC